MRVPIRGRARRSGRAQLWSVCIAEWVHRDNIRKGGPTGIGASEQTRRCRSGRTAPCSARRPAIAKAGRLPGGGRRGRQCARTKCSTAPRPPIGVGAGPAMHSIRDVQVTPERRIAGSGGEAVARDHHRKTERRRQATRAERTPNAATSAGTRKDQRRAKRRSRQAQDNARALRPYRKVRADRRNTDSMRRESRATPRKERQNMQ